MARQDEIQLGMVVRSSDGEKLGKVVRLEPTSFVIEKGFFFPKDYMVRYDEVAAVQGDEALLAHGREHLSTSTQEALDRPATTTLTGGVEPSEEIRVPLVEEELRVTKSVEEAGEVRIHKEVVTEEKQVTVPVSREVVRVERVPAGAGTASASETMFKEQSINIPVHEERIDIEKQPVVREEVLISKEILQDQVTAGATLRREEVDIATEGTERTDLVQEEVAPISGIQGTVVEADRDTPVERATGTGGPRR
jgi:uncharacterized protein (TIGR02271 family)